MSCVCALCVTLFSETALQLKKLYEARVQIVRVEHIFEKNIRFDYLIKICPKWHFWPKITKMEVFAFLVSRKSFVT